MSAERWHFLKLVLKGVAEGRSVRSVISSISNGNEKLALRYQNKYRNLLKNDRELVLKIASTIVDKNGNVVNPYKCEIKKSEYEKLESEIDDLLKRLMKNIK